MARTISEVHREKLQQNLAKAQQARSAKARLRREAEQPEPVLSPLCIIDSPEPTAPAPAQEAHTEGVCVADVQTPSLEAQSAPGLPPGVKELYVTLQADVRMHEEALVELAARREALVAEIAMIDSYLAPAQARINEKHEQIAALETVLLTFGEVI